MGSPEMKVALLTFLVPRRRGHSVVTTTRTQAKADKLRRRYAQHGKDHFDVVIVEDIAKEAAFDQAVVSTPPFDAVCHPTSPFHFAVTGKQSNRIRYESSAKHLLTSCALLRHSERFVPRSRIVTRIISSLTSATELLDPAITGTL